jgi:hypothetical protein
MCQHLGSWRPNFISHSPQDCRGSKQKGSASGATRWIEGDRIINDGQSEGWVQKGQSSEQMKLQHKGLEEEAQPSASNEAAGGVTDEGNLIRRHQ